MLFLVLPKSWRSLDSGEWGDNGGEDGLADDEFLFPTIFNDSPCSGGDLTSSTKSNTYVVASETLFSSMSVFIVVIAAGGRYSMLEFSEIGAN